MSPSFEKGDEKFPKCVALQRTTIPLPSCILFWQQQSRRAEKIRLLQLIPSGPPVEETAPIKAAGSRNYGFKEAVHGISPVSVRPSPVTNRRDAESLLRSKQMPLPVGPAGRTRETAIDIVVTTATDSPVSSYMLASSAVPSGSALPHLDRENRDHTNKIHCGNYKSIPQKRVNGTPPAKPQTRTEPCTSHSR